MNVTAYLLLKCGEGRDDKAVAVVMDLKRLMHAQNEAVRNRWQAVELDADYELHDIAPGVVPDRAFVGPELAQEVDDSDPFIDGDAEEFRIECASVTVASHGTVTFSALDKYADDEYQSEPVELSALVAWGA